MEDTKEKAKEIAGVTSGTFGAISSEAKKKAEDKKVEYGTWPKEGKYEGVEHKGTDESQGV
jgi:hypothetical protein